MTFSDFVLLMIGTLIIVSPFLFIGWVEWKNSRLGSASEYNVRRIKEMCEELGEQLNYDPATLSEKEATQVNNKLRFHVKLKRDCEESERKYKKLF